MDKQSNVVIVFIAFALCTWAVLSVLNKGKEHAVAIEGTPFGVLEFLPWDHSWNSNKYHTQEDLDQAVRLMKDAGISIVRMDFLWQDIEPRKGEFDFAKYDRIVDTLSRNDIQVLGIFNYSADWAASNGAWNTPPRDNTEFVAYAQAVCKRYKDKVKYWEVWNEPDSPTYWEPQDHMKVYCQLLKETYLGLKAVDPSCKVLNGGIANGIDSVNHLYDYGMQDYFDILNLHYFDTPLREGAIKSVEAYPRLAHKIMERHGDGKKKIWITEIGCPGIPQGVTTANWWLAENPTEAQQAEWLRQVYPALLSNPSVEKVFWAFLRDCDNHWGNGTDYLGMVRWDFTPKPAYEAHKEVVAEWKRLKR